MMKFKEYMNEKKENIVVLYHDDMDGYGSALAAYRYLKDTAKYFKVDHGDKLPIKTDDLVYMLDFSVPKSEMLKLLKIAKKIIVVDHHERQAKDLLTIKEDNFEITFDNNLSGATLSWKYFHKSKPPIIFKYISDYDLWKFKYPDTKAVSAWLFKNIYENGKDFKDLEKIPDLKEIIKDGNILLNKKDKELTNILKSTYEVEFEGYKVGVVDNDTDFSELGNRLAKKYTFGVVRGKDKKDKNKFVYGLRSIGDFDVSIIAKKYSGNGHKNASGFSQPKSRTIWRKL